MGKKPLGPVEEWMVHSMVILGAASMYLCVTYCCPRWRDHTAAA
jgi:hypothetical protein